MRWIVSIVIGILTAVAGAFAVGTVAAGCVEWYRISSFEGQSGYFVVFMGLLGIAFGFVTGAVTGALTHRAGAKGFFRSLGLSLAIVLGITGTAAGVCWLAADRPPTINGHFLDLAFEVRSPRTVREKPQDAPDGLKVLLYAGGKSVWYAALDFEHARIESDQWVTPGLVAMVSSKPDRQLAVWTGSGAAQYLPLDLPPKPRTVDEAWSEWKKTANRGDLVPMEPAEEYALRYKVQMRSGDL